MEDNQILFYDPITTRYFRSSIEEIKKAKEKLVSICETKGDANLNDYIESLKIGSHSSIGDYISLSILV